MLSENVKLSLAASYAAGTSDVNGATLDMQGYDGVLVICTLAAIAAGATTDLRMQGGDESDASDMADLTGTAGTIADSDDDTVRYIDLYQPQSRYVRCVLNKDASNSVAASIVYLQYRSKTGPITQPSGVSGEAHASPAAGTA